MHGTFSKRDHITAYETSLSKFEKIEMIPNYIFQPQWYEIKKKCSMFLMNIGAKTLNKMLTNGIQCYIKGKGNLTPIYKASSQQKNQSWQEKQSVK